MPSVKHRGISKRVNNPEERGRLRDIINGIKFLRNYGCIVRTAATNRDKKQIVADFKYLHKIWSQVLKGSKKNSAPALLHEESSLIMRIVRDHLHEGIDEFVIDNKEEYKKIVSYLGSVMPEMKKKVMLYKNDDPVFDYYGIEREIQKIYRKTVSLRCGGYLVIEQTEALVAIDINTGRNVGRGDFEKTVFKTNMEAAMEIPRQLRLRDIGGIVIIDFIDMKSRKNQQEVFNALLRELRKDKSRTNVLQISRMGLVEMTRQRRGIGLYKKLHESCPYCEGTGHVKSVLSCSLDMLRKIKLAFLRAEGRDVILYLHPKIADSLLTEYRDPIEKLEKRFKKRLDIRREYDFHIEQFRLVSGSNKKELEIR